MEANSQTTGDAGYPVQFSVDYPDRDLNRLMTAFRVIVAIPIVIVLAAVSNGGANWGWADWEGGGGFAAGTGGVLFFPVLLMIVFRQKYPRWWFDWNLELLRFENRVVAYLALMDDRYPSTDERQAVTVDFSYPDAKQQLNRWLPLVKWFLAIPHYIVLIFLALAALVAVIIAWFAILFTGRYPRGLFDFVEGVIRWGTRVQAYAFVLVTDRYPPFQLNP
jgi:small-conductance mechanosensitive channel